MPIDFLLNIKDFEYITVKDICLKAKVNRSTFYLHYLNVNDLLEDRELALSEAKKTRRACKICY